MEILERRQELLEYLPHIRSSPKEWQIIEMRIVEGINFAAADAARITHNLFNNKEGKIYICNEREVLALVHGGNVQNPASVADIIVRALPEKSCQVAVHEATPEGFAKLVLFIGPPKAADASLAGQRRARKENVVLVADDDMYMRMLVKKGIPPYITAHEVITGTEVVDAYKKHNPDILFLDIHLPGIEGTEILKSILSIDKDAYVIMLSADSSKENVEFTSKLGTKDFLTKPFSKDRLLECVNQCPTLSHAT